MAAASAALIFGAGLGGGVLAGGSGGGLLFGGAFGGGHFGGGFGGGHFGGQTMGMTGAHGFATSRGLGHSHVAHDYRDHHYRGRYGLWPQYGYNNCTWPYYNYNSCYAYGG